MTSFSSLRSAAAAFLFLFLIIAPACGASVQDETASNDGDTPLNPIGDYTPLVIKTAAGDVFRFQAEVRDDYEGRAMGLMHRTFIGPDKAMIFIFPYPDRQGFWMKNTLIPLDMLFIRTTGRVANIRENVEPQTLTSRTSQGRVIAVLELAGGRATELGIKAGDTVYHATLGNMEMAPADPVSDGGSADNAVGGNR